MDIARESSFSFPHQPNVHIDRPDITLETLENEAQFDLLSSIQKTIDQLTKFHPLPDAEELTDADRPYAFLMQRLQAIRYYEANAGSERPQSSGVHYSGAMFFYFGEKFVTENGKDKKDRSDMYSSSKRTDLLLGIMQSNIEVSGFLNALGVVLPTRRSLPYQMRPKNTCEIKFKDGGSTIFHYGRETGLDKITFGIYEPRNPRYWYSFVSKKIPLLRVKVLALGLTDQISVKRTPVINLTFIEPEKLRSLQRK